MVRDDAVLAAFPLTPAPVPPSALFLAHRLLAPYDQSTVRVSVQRGRHAVSPIRLGLSDTASTGRHSAGGEHVVAMRECPWSHHLSTRDSATLRSSLQTAQALIARPLSRRDTRALYSMCRKPPFHNTHSRLAGPPHMWIRPTDALIIFLPV